MRWIALSFFIPVILLSSCSVSRLYNADKKYSPGQLKCDYLLLREILEKKHPSLYWYTSKDVMDYYFDQGYQKITDSMTELAFGWHIIAPLLAHIHCGHTSVALSRDWQKFMRNRYVPSFPLYVKTWKDTMMVVANINRDSTLTRGDFISSINGIPNQAITESLFQYMSADGYADNLKYIRLSTGFPYFFRNTFGVYPQYRITFTDSTGNESTTDIKWWLPPEDTTAGKKPAGKRRHSTPAKRRENIRSITSDSSVAIMDVNAFSKGRLNRFFRKKFKKIEKEKIDNLIIDLRINGGGDVSKAVNLARYIRKTSFRVADSVYSVSKNFGPYSRYISQSFINNKGLIFLSRKRSDGKYHFGFWERHLFRPRRKNHFDGNVYVLTNGLTFSAASLFCSLVREQGNVTLVGEETGGGWYGNSGILIPNITLPVTGLRVRLPFFRLVQYEHKPEMKGSGVVPEWYIGPDWRDILNGRDTKLNAVLKKIRENE